MKAKLAEARTERRDVRVNGHKTVIRIRPNVWTAFTNITKARDTNTQKVMNEFRVNNVATDLVPAIETYIAEHSSEPVYDYNTREQWLSALVDAFRPVFAERGYPLPERIQVAIGFTSKGLRGRSGECWSSSGSSKGWTEIFISPLESDAVRIANILCHELCHAADNCKSGHGKRFRQIGEALDLEGNPKSMLGGDIWKSWATPIVESAGPIPHAFLIAPERKIKKQSTRMLKCECPECGAIWRTSSKVIEQIIAHHNEIALQTGATSTPTMRCVDPFCDGFQDLTPPEVPEEE